MDTRETFDVAASARYGSVAFSCVVDRDPSLIAQCFVWVNCLLDIQAISPGNIFVHHTCIPNVEFLNWLRSRGVNLVEITPYDARSPHCNKICQLRTFSRLEFSHVVLMDCDTAWIGDAALPLHAPVAAKIVDLAKPPEPILSRLFKEARLGKPHWVKVSFSEGTNLERTDHNNCNGGLYILRRSLIPRLDVAWRKWANWCLDRLDLLGEFFFHVDQVSFALALREAGLRVHHLPMQWNYPLHLPRGLLPNLRPQILHFHRELSPHFHLDLTGVPQPDEAINYLNTQISRFLQTHFINSVFWDFRYKVSPEVGSGVGSRGEVLSAKRLWIGYALDTFKNKRVVDVGCGDLEVTRSLPLTQYTGIDLSEHAIDIARSKRPDWQFRQVQLCEWADATADAVMCLDVLIHQKRREEFDQLMRSLVATARERLIVGGYDEPPRMTSEIVSFHRPLTEVLKDSGKFQEISIIGRYRDCVLVVADTRARGPGVHPNDMAPREFNEASSLTTRPDLLRVLADLSRETFGFYTKHFSRALEYPWIAHKLETVSPGQRALDIGAGLNPLPLFLARQGAIVDCVDPHTLVRVPPSGQDWNEWGFFDYRRVHPNLRSHNVDVLAFKPDAALDVIYSVSVVEHMPRVTWERLLYQCSRWLAPNGRLLLTIDLIPGTQLLWNYSEGKEVEPTSVHGDVDAFAAQLGAVGLKPIDAFVWQNVPQSRTDLFFVECERY